MLSILAWLLCLASLFGVLNHRLLRPPPRIGVLVLALTASLLLIACDFALPGLALRMRSQWLPGSVDLPIALLDGVPCVLLFAGSLHVEVDLLWRCKGMVLALAMAGTLIATALLGSLMWLAFRLCGVPVSASWCVVLSAMVAPTDPVAVAGLLRRIGLPPELQTVFAGESLFNDGVEVVVFGVALGLAAGTGHPGVFPTLRDFLVEAGAVGCLACSPAGPRSWSCAAWTSGTPSSPSRARWPPAPTSWQTGPALPGRSRWWWRGCSPAITAPATP